MTKLQTDNWEDTFVINSIKETGWNIFSVQFHEKIATTTEGLSYGDVFSSADSLSLCLKSISFLILFNYDTDVHDL
jgi:hypothetical protein